MAKVGGLDKTEYKQIIATEPSAVFQSQGERVQKVEVVTAVQVARPSSASTSFSHKTFSAPDPDAKPWYQRQKTMTKPPERNIVEAMRRPRAATIDVPMKVSFADNNPKNTAGESASVNAVEHRKEKSAITSEPAAPPTVSPAATASEPITPTPSPLTNSNQPTSILRRKATIADVYELLDIPKPQSKLHKTPSWYTRELDFITVQLYNGTRAVSLEATRKLKIKSPYSLPDMTVEAFDLVWRLCVHSSGDAEMAAQFIVDKQLTLKK